MNKLWMYLPPLQSDVFGVQALIDKTDGLAVIDDSSSYRGSQGGSWHKGGRPQEAQNREAAIHSGEREGHWRHEGGAPEGRHGGPHGGPHGMRGHWHGGRGGKGFGADVRTISTGIRSADTVNGTREKILAAAKEGVAAHSAQFVLLGSAPCASMIGTDLPEAAQAIAEQTGVPTFTLEVDGHKTYDSGVSLALEAFAKHLTKPTEMQKNSVQLMGACLLDHGEENLKAEKRWAEQAGMQVLSQWGGQCNRADFENAAAAECNLVTAVSGLKAARYLESTYGTRYVAAAPFGRTWSQQVAQAMKEGAALPCPCVQDGAPEVLILAEQLTGNALRNTLALDYGMKNIQVVTFCTLDKALAEGSDKKLKGEEELRTLLQDGSYKLVFCDNCCKVLLPEGLAHICLPYNAFFESTDALPNFVGEGLNNWLDAVLPENAKK